MISRVIEAKRRRHARLPRGGRRHLALQGAPQGDREPHLRHAREPRAPAGRARRDRQADPPPAAPGGHGAPLPGPEGAGAPASPPSCWRCGCASSTAAPRCTTRAVREKDLVMQAALADLRAAEAAIDKQRVFQSEQSDQVSQIQGRYFSIGADISAHRAADPVHARDCATASAKTCRSRAPRWPTSPIHIDRDEQELIAIREELERIAPDLEQTRAAEQACLDGPRRRRACAGRLAAGLGILQPRPRRRAPDRAGRARAHRAAREPAAPAAQPGRPHRRRARRADRPGVAAAPSARSPGANPRRAAIADELSRALSAALGDVQALRAAAAVDREGAGGGARAIASARAPR